MTKLEQELYNTIINDIESVPQDQLNNTSEAILNSFITTGKMAGLPTAFALIESQKGRTALAANGYCLALKFKPETLNAIVIGGLYDGQSVSFALAKRMVGLEILAANNYYLASRVHAKTLNKLAANISNYRTMAEILTTSPRGMQILAANNYELALQIEGKTIDRRPQTQRTPLGTDIVFPTFREKILNTPLASFVIPYIDQHLENNKRILLLALTGIRNTVFKLPEAILGIIRTMLDGRRSPVRTIKSIKPQVLTDYEYAEKLDMEQHKKYTEAKNRRMNRVSEILRGNNTPAVKNQVGKEIASPCVSTGYYKKGIFYSLANDEWRIFFRQPEQASVAQTISPNPNSINCLRNKM